MGALTGPHDNVACWGVEPWAFPHWRVGNSVWAPCAPWRSFPVAAGPLEGADLPRMKQRPREASPAILP